MIDAARVALRDATLLKLQQAKMGGVAVRDEWRCPAIMIYESRSTTTNVSFSEKCLFVTTDIGDGTAPARKLVEIEYYDPKYLEKLMGAILTRR